MKKPRTKMTELAPTPIRELSADELIRVGGGGGGGTYQRVWSAGSQTSWDVTSDDPGAQI